MAIDIEIIKEFLTSKEIKYILEPDKNIFIVDIHNNLIAIRLEENGEFLQFRTFNFYKYQSGEYKTNIIELLCSMNYSRKLVKFGYDEKDGEINVCVDFPIEDSEITSNQFFRCMGSLIEALEECKTRLNTILETGKDPGTGTPKIIDKLVKDIMESLEKDDI